ncbi:MAG: TRAP transporter small permease [Xanthomonadales bacterium]|nr:TRAP transporter small permease [Xanthomonadales bacterium]
MKRGRRILATFGRIGEMAENALLVLLLLAMVLLSATQIILRNFFDVGFYWSDELLRMMVLWVAVAGAVAATRSDKHISINLLDSFAGPALRKTGKLIAHLFGGLICALMTWVSIDFVSTSREYGDVLLGATPAWILQLVLPVGFGLMTWRYLVLLVGDVLALANAETGSEGEGA